MRFRFGRGYSGTPQAAATQDRDFDPGFGVQAMSKLEDVASKAGVSPRTVARVLRGDLQESWASTAARAKSIRDIADKLGYKPNSSARAVRSGKFSCVGMLLSSLNGRSYLPEPLLDGIQDQLHDLGYRLTLGKLPDFELVETEAFPKILREWCCDGLLVNYTDRIPPAMLKHLKSNAVPSIWLNCKMPNDCVYYDDEAAGYELTKQLLERGHKRIDYIDFTTPATDGSDHYSRADRYRGYVRAMQEMGLTPVTRTKYADIAVTDRLDALKNILQTPDRPTAVVTYDAGHRVLFAAALVGLDCPRDLSIASFSTANLGGERHGENFIGRQVTCMVLPTHRAGRMAVDNLLKKIHRPHQRLKAVVLPAGFEPGDTIAPPMR